MEWVSYTKLWNAHSYKADSSHTPHIVSFVEFKKMFSKNTSQLKSEVFGADGGNDDTNLIGLDAKIPGGR